MTHDPRLPVGFEYGFSAYNWNCSKNLEGFVHQGTRQVSLKIYSLKNSASLLSGANLSLAMFA